MASSLQSSEISINFHHGGRFVTNPLSYDFDMCSKLEKVDINAMDYSQFVSFLEQESHAFCKGLFYVLPGKDLQNGLSVLNSDAKMHDFRQYAFNNDCVIDIYMAHTEFNLNESMKGTDIGGSESEDDYDVYVVYSSDEEDTASVDHLSDGEDEVFDIRTKKKEPKTKKKAKNMFDGAFLARVFNSLERETYVESKVSPDDELLPEDQDKLGDEWPIHDPNQKWKYMHPKLGERFEGPDQLKRCLTFYALANGYRLYYETNDAARICCKCCKPLEDSQQTCSYRLWASWMQKERSFQVKTLIDEHTCSRSYEFGTLITCNWIARNYAKKIMANPKIRVRQIQEAILKKYKCKVTQGQARRGKIKALQQFETCLEDHYGLLWSYAQEIRDSNPGSTCIMNVDPMPNGKNYFKRFYVCFKGLKSGWVEGCRRVIGLDGCFLKTICKGELLSAVGRDGNNQIYPIAWAVVNVENKDNWSWFMECLVQDLDLQNGDGLTIISDQHKGIVEAAKEVIPLAEHRQCARHIYANFRKKFSGVLYRNLFWKAAKATYPEMFEKVMNEMKTINKDAHKHLMDRQPKSWSRAFLTTGRSCDAVENGISECFNSLIVDARRKPIINMLEDIRVYIMDRMKKQKDKHSLWTDAICPSIRKKVELIKDMHRKWKVIPSGEHKYEVRPEGNSLDSYQVDELNKTCSCRVWQLSGIPCKHGFAVVYHLHKNPDGYVSEWFKTANYGIAYNHYIYPLKGMSQWPPTEFIKPLPPIVRRMPGRPKHKRRRDATECDGNRQRLSRVGRIMHCKNCGKAGHNKTTCKEPQTVHGGMSPKRVITRPRDGAKRTTVGIGLSWEEEMVREAERVEEALRSSREAVIQEPARVEIPTTLSHPGLSQPSMSQPGFSLAKDDQIVIE